MLQGIKRVTSLIATRIHTWDPVSVRFVMLIGGSRLLKKARLLLLPLQPVCFKFCHQATAVNKCTDMDLKAVTKALKTFAPTTLAGSWDNVGLLIEPTAPHVVSSMLLTNDLSERVIQEALEKQVNMILSYHPPIFMPLKQLTQSQWKERVIIKCIENRIALYSPHTSYDAVSGGLSDWLISPFVGKVAVIEQQTATDFPTGGGYRLEFMLPPNSSGLTDKLKSLPNVNLITDISKNETQRHVTYNCSEKALAKAVECINTVEDARVTMEIFQCIKPPIPNTGAGRICTMKDKRSISDIVQTVKSHLNLQYVRLALASNATSDSLVKSVAVCAGSGSSVLRGVKVDLWLTGELSHHEILDANHRGTTVILCDHSNTERGYLTVLKSKLNGLFNEQVNIYVSETDRDPLEVV